MEISCREPAKELEALLKKLGAHELAPRWTDEHCDERMRQTSAKSMIERMGDDVALQRTLQAIGVSWETFCEQYAVEAYEVTGIQSYVRRLFGFDNQWRSYEGSLRLFTIPAIAAKMRTCFVPTHFDGIRSLFTFQRISTDGTVEPMIIDRGRYEVSALLKGNPVIEFSMLPHVSDVAVSFTLPASGVISVKVDEEEGCVDGWVNKYRRPTGALRTEQNFKSVCRLCGILQKEKEELLVERKRQQSCNIDFLRYGDFSIRVHED